MITLLSNAIAIIKTLVERWLPTREEAKKEAVEKWKREQQEKNLELVERLKGPKP